MAALEGKEWDEIDEVKHAAISAAGELLRRSKDCAIFRKLMEYANKHGTELSGRYALEALAWALGEPHSKSIVPRDVEAAACWIARIRSRAEERLISECA